MNPPVGLSAVRRDDLLLDRLGRGLPRRSNPAGVGDRDEITRLLSDWRQEVVVGGGPAREMATGPLAAPRLVGSPVRRPARRALVGLVVAVALATAGGAAAAAVSPPAGHSWSMERVAPSRHVVVGTPPVSAPPGPVTRHPNTGSHQITATALPGSLPGIADAAALSPPGPSAEPVVAPARSRPAPRASRKQRRCGLPAWRTGRRAHPGQCPSRHRPKGPARPGPIKPSPAKPSPGSPAELGPDSPIRLMEAVIGRPRPGGSGLPGLPG